VQMMPNRCFEFLRLKLHVDRSLSQQIPPVEPFTSDQNPRGATQIANPPPNAFFKWMPEGCLPWCPFRTASFGLKDRPSISV
jgi:hypothetical protein